MTPVVAQKLRRHGFHFAGVEKIQKESFDNVVAVMPQRVRLELLVTPSTSQLPHHQHVFDVRFHERVAPRFETQSRIEFRSLRLGV